MEKPAQGPDVIVVEHVAGGNGGRSHHDKQEHRDDVRDRRQDHRDDKRDRHEEHRDDKRDRKD